MTPDLNVAVVVADIALVLAAAALMGAVARKLGQPPVVGEIVTGILLGPSLLGLLPGDLNETLFPAYARPYLAMIAQVGLLLFMFLVGWEFNTRLLRRASVTVVSVSMTGMVGSFLLGLAVAAVVFDRHQTVDGEPVPFAAFGTYLGIALSITAFPVLARILTDTGLQHTTVGAVVLASAAIQDVLAWILLAVVVASLSAGAGSSVGAVVGYLLLYAVVTLALARPLLFRVVARLTRGGVASPYLIPVLGAGLFLSAYATSWIGVHEIFGAFVFGLIMPRTPRDLLARQVREPFELGNRLLLPIFFASVGLSVDIGALDVAGAAELLLIIVVACLGKLFGAGLPARWCGMTWRDSYSIGLLMNTRGLTELVIINVGVALGVLDGAMFTMLVVMALVTTAMTVPLLPRSLTRAAAGFALPPEPPPGPVETGRTLPTLTVRPEPGGEHAEQSPAVA